MAVVNFYEILEVAPTAAPEEIQQAVRAQRRVWVRRQSSPDPDRRTAAETRVRQIDEAEKTLLDAAARSAYDRRLRAEQAGPRERPGARTTGSAPRRQAHDPGRGRPPEPTRREDGAEWVRRGRDYLDQGNHGAAYRAGVRATGIAPENIEGWLLAGDAALAQDRLDEAEDAFAEAVRLRPDEPAGHLGLGQVFYERRDWARAQRTYETVLELDPRLFHARLVIGQIHLATGRRDEGMAIIEEIAAEQPGDPAVASSLANALYNATLGGLDQLEDGTFIPNSRRQVRLVDETERRMAQLGAVDPDSAELRESLGRLRADAKRAVWSPSGHKRFYAIAFFLPLLLAFTNAELGPQVVAGVLMALVVLTYIVRHCKPAWKARRKEIAPYVVKKGV